MDELCLNNLKISSSREIKKNVNEIDSFVDTCTGCSLCAQLCLQNAIEMKPDKEGFVFPVINKQLCNHCGKCAHFCSQIQSENSQKSNIDQVYACQAKNLEILIEATAGGLFPTISYDFIENGGIVYGAVYDKNMNVVHVPAADTNDIDRMNGSKYVQSDISSALVSAKQYLKKGYRVLFSGTPCQISALKKYCVDIDIANLYTIDVVCYGVPSPKLFHYYLYSLEKEHNAKITDYRFRDKHTYGWSHTTVINMQHADGSYIRIEEPDYSKIPYFKMFGSKNCFRKSCYNCKFNLLHRESDITTGNFWGIGNISNLFDVKLGVSMALINSEKGSVMFKRIASQMIVEERTIEEAIRGNAALVVGSVYPKNRDEIYDCFNRYGFDRVVKKYYTENWRTRVVEILRFIKIKSLTILSYK